eukprot:GEMP01054878.1.p1 GENE.GEMP01054878.1~~GEMP01054878.1.p1  ORF type:complete len:324 (+),score=105.16 GEMP01054878.1:51-974(+)
MASFSGARDEFDIDALIAAPELEAELNELKQLRQAKENEAVRAVKRENRAARPADSDALSAVITSPKKITSLADAVLDAPTAMEELDQLEQQLDCELRKWRQTVGADGVHADIAGRLAAADELLITGRYDESTATFGQEDAALVVEDAGLAAQDAGETLSEGEDAEKEPMTEAEKERLELQEELELLRSEFQYLDNMYPDEQLGTKYEEATKSVSEDHQPAPEPQPIPPEIVEPDPVGTYDDAAIAEEMERLNRRLKGLEAKRKIESDISLKLTPIPQNLQDQTEYLRKRMAPRPKGLINLDKSLFT